MICFDVFGVSLHDKTTTAEKRIKSNVNATDNLKRMFIIPPSFDIIYRRKIDYFCNSLILKKILYHIHIYCI